MELLAPAGSPEALLAAVQNGADAVYMGLGSFNARRSARNFTDETFAAAVAYCHEHGVRVYLTLNTLLTDRELPTRRKRSARQAPGAWTRCWCRTGACGSWPGQQRRICPSTPAPR